MIDLHVHSTFSDGSFPPEDLIVQAKSIHLAAIALTDHDTTDGVGRFLAEARSRSVRAVAGVEISADFKVGTFHMLGYFIRHDDSQLNQRLAWLREGREARNAEILGKLTKLGMKLSWDEVRAFAGEDVVGRPHFAQAMMARGYVLTKDEAFEKYLGKGKAGYAERRRLTPEDSIRLIRDAGGVAVLAHPFTLGLTPPDLRKLVGQLKDWGLGGIEVYYSEHTSDMERQYRDLAHDFGLVSTGGSDFHGALSPDIKLGRGFGSLRVPDEVVDQLESRRTSA